MSTQRLGGAVACIATFVLATSVASGRVASEPPQSRPVETASVLGSKEPVRTATGVLHSCAVRNDGAVLSWRYDGSGRGPEKRLLPVLLRDVP